MFSSIRKLWETFGSSHLIFCTEGRSWRKSVYEPYKKNRTVLREALTPEEQEENRIFWEAFEELIQFIQTNTNCTVLNHPNLEADDLIAGFCTSHPNDSHIIVSSDTDYFQLLSENIQQYNGITQELHTIHGIFDDKNNRVINKKTGEPKEPPDPAWLLFEKCIRGDSTDNVFSAYPGVRTKSTKKKIGLREAFEDRIDKGYAWNNLMMQKWVDHNGETHRVLDDYERNRELIDLTNQPEYVKQYISDAISAIQPKQVGQVGVRLLQFCHKHELERVSASIQSYALPFNKPYPNEIT